MELTRTFTPDQYARGLESWQWLVGADQPLEPVFTSLFGDVFFRAPDGFWWLDALEGSLSRPWTTVEALRADLDTPDGQDQYLLGGLAFGADNRGLKLEPEQVYCFTVSPIIGGPINLDNIGVLDFVVALDIAGQIHDQARNMPPGTVVSGFSVAD